MSTIAPATSNESRVHPIERLPRADMRRPESTAVVALSIFTLMAIIAFVAPPRWGADSGLAASLDKHARLEACRSPKIVFIGGSNVSLGVDSEAIEKALHRDTVNMGMGASMGLRYQLEEVRQQIKRGDLLVLLPEYGNFYNMDKDYSNSHLNGSYELLNLYQASPDTLRWIWAVYSSSPEAFFDGLDNVRRFIVLKAKFYKKLVGDLVQGQKSLWSSDLLKPTQTMYTHRDAYNSHGDFTAHLKLNHPVLAPFEPIIPGEYTGFDKKSTDYLNEYELFAESKGASLVILPPVFPKNVQCRLVTLDIYEHWKSLLKFPVLASPDRYSFEWSELFDTPYHVDARGRVKRTRLLIEDLQKVVSTQRASEK